MLAAQTDLAARLRDAVQPLATAEDYAGLVKAVGGARFVLIGEATHGTHEFYRERAEITKRLITELGFNAVAVEADWPDAYRVNRFVREESADADAEAALGDFKRFPHWMWRNRDVREFIAWLREYNQGVAPPHQVGFYGLDLYSLNSSMAAVLEYLDKIDPEAAERARQRYACFDHFHNDTEVYGYATMAGVAPTCEEKVVRQLMEMRRHAHDYVHRDGRVAADAYFFAEQNARLVKNAEQYYRSMFQGRVASWNLRDRHMTGTIEALEKHLATFAPSPKIIVWEHNSHLGDASATEIGEQGEVNVGQLMRGCFPGETLLVGLTTHSGSVTAASDWGGPAERKRVRPALAGTCEAMFHQLGLKRFMLNLRSAADGLKTELRRPRLQRAIGVIYLPETERRSHYFHARLADQFDLLFHFDETRAVEPLERNPEWNAGEAPETFPTGM